MKKLVSVTLTVSLMGLLLAGCGGAKTADASAPAATAVKTGLGHSISIAKSADAAADKAGNAQSDTVMAAVTIDDKGVILAVDIDTAQVKIPFDAAGKITADKAAALKTKDELGKDYGMNKVSTIGKDWHEQIAELEKWMVGKTLDQVKAIKVKEADGKKLVDEADLKTKVTVGVEDYIAVVEEAVKNAK